MAAAKKKPAGEKPAVQKASVARATAAKPAAAKPTREPRRKKVAAPVAAEAEAPEVAGSVQAVEEAAASAAVKKGRTLRYLLPANMEIAALGPVHRDLVALEAGNEGPFVLDGANLSVIDTAGLQLLISFVTAVQASGKKVSWDNYSVQAYQLASELGVVDQLGD